MGRRLLHIAHGALFAGTLLVLGCAQLFPAGEKPQPVTPQITDDMLRERAREQLALGVKQYETGEFDNAHKSLVTSLDHGLLLKPEQSRARKYLAFIYCVSNREQLCYEEFRKAFEINPDFALSAAEDGHPVWGPVYRNVRTQLIAEREASVRKPMIPFAKAEQMLSDGIVKYDTGDYQEAQRLLEGSLKEGLKEKSDQVKAIKHVAFTLCLQGKHSHCKSEFVKIFELEPAFDLSPAEAGHPSWAKTFAAAKAQALKAQAKAAKEKTRAPTAPAVVPPKTN